MPRGQTSWCTKEYQKVSRSRQGGAQILQLYGYRALQVEPTCLTLQATLKPCRSVLPEASPIHHGIHLNLNLIVLLSPPPPLVV